MDKGKNVSMEVFHLVSLKFAGAGDVAKNFNDVSDLSLNVSIATGSVYSQNGQREYLLRPEESYTCVYYEKFTTLTASRFVI